MHRNTLFMHWVKVILICCFTAQVSAQAFIDPSLAKFLHKPTKSKKFSPLHIASSIESKNNISLILMTSIENCEHLNSWISDAFGSKEYPAPFKFNQLCLLTIEVNAAELGPAISFLKTKPLQIWQGKAGREELTIAAQTLGLRDNDDKAISWWQNSNEPGSKTVLGLLDSGIAKEHPSLNQKIITVIGDQLGEYINDVRTAHGTGVAGIILGDPINSPYKGIAYGVKNIVSAFAGDLDSEGSEIAGLNLTFKNLSTLIESDEKVDAINYSFGNGDAGCKDYNQPSCQYLQLAPETIQIVDWSPMARIVDAIVEDHNIFWAKSAGNAGWAAPSDRAPFNNGLTVPGDNYNGITVANMDSTNYTDSKKSNSANRDAPHVIRYTSSRGPTLLGRRKPDLTAPGHNTRTGAPDPEVYFNPEKNKKFKAYTKATKYDSESQTRLLTGTSAATPFVTGAGLLIKDYAIKHPEEKLHLQNPLAIKALLINSADTWTDNSQPGPYDKHNVCASGIENNCGHAPVYRSEWNPTYGWGYLNLANAYQQRHYVHADLIKPLTDASTEHFKVYQVKLRRGDKVTLTWLRHTGFVADDNELSAYKLNNLQLALFNPVNNRIIIDDSIIDNVLQVANAERFNQTKLDYEDVYVIVHTSAKSFDKVGVEKFAIAASGAIQQVQLPSLDEKVQKEINKLLQ